jgi:hypothetical protein
MCLPCCHVILVLRKFKDDSNIIQCNIWDYVHPAYKITEIQKCYGDLDFVIPSSYQLLSTPFTMKIEPPPRYNMKNEEIFEFIPGPGIKQVRRFALKGESKGGRTSLRSPMKKARVNFIQTFIKNYAMKKLKIIHHSITKLTIQQLIKGLLK